MTLLLETPPLPMQVGSDGIIRLSGTRVTLDSLLASFLQGATPEEMAQQFDTLPLADIYSVIGYYLQRRDEIDAYLQQGAAETDLLQARCAADSITQGIRERLLSRKNQHS